MEYGQLTVDYISPVYNEAPSLVFEELVLQFAIHMLSFVTRRYFATTRMVSQATTEKVQQLIKSKPIFIASKSYCPYCHQTKKTIGGITNEAYILELDEETDGGEIQEALLELTGQRTVPNVFIGGEHIGGNSDVQTLKSADKLEDKIKAVL